MTDGSVGAPPGPGRGADPQRHPSAPGAVGGLRSASDGTRTSEPRFAFRVTRGHVELSLSRPLRGDGGYLNQLVLEPLGLSFPLDLSGGVARFRHRATRVRSAEWSLPLGGLSAMARARGVKVNVYPGEPRAGVPQAAGQASSNERPRSWLEAVGGTHVYAVFEDAFGHVGVEFCVWGRGQSVHLWPASMHSVRPSPNSAFARVFALMGRLGAEWDERAGDFRVATVASGLLAEALVVRGWRLPRVDAAAVHVQMGVQGLGVSLGLETESAARPEVWAKVLAPVYRLWSEGETLVALDTLERAEKALVRQVERSVYGGRLAGATHAFDAPAVEAAANRVVRGLRAVLLAELAPESSEAEAQLSALTEVDGSHVAARLRVALSAAAQARDVEKSDDSQAALENTVAALALSFATSESDGAFVADVLRAAADVPTVAPADRARLLREALERAPADVEVLMAALLAGQLSSNVSRRVSRDLYGRLQRALALCPAGRARAELGSRAAAALSGHVHPAFVVSLLRDALVESPQDADVLDALARAELSLATWTAEGQRAGTFEVPTTLPQDLEHVRASLGGAAERARHAAEAFDAKGDGRLASRAFVLRAEVLEEMGEWEASAEALSCALRCEPEQPRVVVALFRAYTLVGRHGQAAATLHRLVAHGFTATDEWGEALAEAAIYFLKDADDPVAARPFVSALQRLRPFDGAVSQLALLLEGREADLSEHGSDASPEVDGRVHPSDADWALLSRSLLRSLSATVPGSEPAPADVSLHGADAPTAGSVPGATKPTRLLPPSMLSDAERQALGAQLSAGQPGEADALARAVLESVGKLGDTETMARLAEVLESEGRLSRIPMASPKRSTVDSWANLADAGNDAAAERPTVEWMREPLKGARTDGQPVVVPAETLPGLSLLPEEAPLPSNVVDVVKLADAANEAGDMAMMRGALRTAREALASVRTKADARALVTAQEVLRRVLQVAIDAVGEGPARAALLKQLQHLELEIAGV